MNLDEGLRLLRIYTAGQMDLYALAGQPKASCRAHVMAGLLGVDKVPQSKAGITALRAAFYEAAGIIGPCEAVRERAFITFAKAHAPEPVITRATMAPLAEVPFTLAAPVATTPTAAQLQRPLRFE